MMWGGIIAFVNNNDVGYVQECYSSASISGTTNVGGILGNGRCNIINCYANGSSNAGLYAGGLAGYVWQSTIMNCYSSAVVVNGGGLVGDSDAGGEAGSTALNSYWDTEASGQVISELGTGYSTEIMKFQAVYSGWDFETTWTMDGTYNDGYPYLQSMVPTETALPISLTQFNVLFEKAVVDISWKTESETDNACFLIYRDNEVIASINGSGTTSEPHSYAYRDKDIIPGRSYTYLLADVSYANELIKHEDMAVTIVSSENDVTPSYELGENYPNPFNPSTQIPVTLSVESDIRLDIYDMSGKLIRNLVNAPLPAGYHEILWDGRDNNGKEANTGMYITTLSNGELNKSQKMLLIK